jgi:hypothetical protein
MGKGHEETVSVPLGIDEAYRRALSATDAFNRAKVSAADEQAHRVELKVGMSFKSWGEKVTIGLTPEGEGVTRADLSSQASLGTTMVDYGKNHDNVQQVKDWLLGSEGATAA